MHCHIFLHKKDNYQKVCEKGQLQEGNRLNIHYISVLIIILFVKKDAAMDRIVVALLLQEVEQKRLLLQKQGWDIQITRCKM
ncbi:MAG: hypothetical protein KME12_17870 [Trichocoleus desertorum ATA4-8-CV12]|jgi:hypothetical protein|nr:hypothetical protein [Trichocoleus desertorum ATA4-8-CV12]